MRKWLIGCGVLVGFAVVGLIIMTVVVTSWVKKRLPDTDKIKQVQAELDRRFGDPKSFVPPLDGSLPADRLETFVAVRDSLATRRAESAAILTRFVRAAKQDRPENRPAVDKIADAIGLAQGGAVMVSGVLEFAGRRANLLLDAGMGEGEYEYYYGLTTFSWLEWDPIARPDDEETIRSLGTLSDVQDARHAIGKTLLVQLENQRQALEKKAPRSPAEDAMLKTLQGELDDAHSTGRFPFAGRVPESYVAALTPYRARLEATLPKTPAEAVLDLVRFKSERGGFQFTFDADRGTSGHRPAPH